MTEPKARIELLRELAKDIREGKLRPWFYAKDMRFADNCDSAAEYLEKFARVNIVVAPTTKRKKVSK